jgi:hypothetical protein
MYKYIQSASRTLEIRTRQLKAAWPRVYHYSLVRYWNYLHENPIFVDVFNDLERRYAYVERDVSDIFRLQVVPSYTSDMEHVACCYFVMKECAKSPEIQIEYDLGDKQSNGLPAQHKFFNMYYLDPLYYYLDEQLNGLKLTISSLMRYKQKCEWFERKLLFDKIDKIDEDTSTAEKKLKSHLYDYLHDQGARLIIEPYSHSGEIDLFYDQRGEDRIFAEVKVIKSSAEKHVIVEGFNQLYIYLNDFNSAVGYLVIYKACEKDVSFDLKTQLQLVPFETHNNKTIFFIVIDVFPHKLPSSKRGRLKTIRITSDELVKSIAEEIED